MSACVFYFSLLAIAVISAKAYEIDNVQNSEGWIPNEKSFQELRDHFEEQRRNTHIQPSVEKSWNPMIDYTTERIQLLKDTALNLVRPQDLYQNSLRREKNTHYIKPENVQTIKPFDIDKCKEQDVLTRVETKAEGESEFRNEDITEATSDTQAFRTINNIGTTAEGLSRKAKELSELNSFNDITTSNNAVYKTDNSKAEFKEHDNKEEKGNNYEVTENIDKADVLNLETNKIEQSGYRPPEFNSMDTRQNNLTNTFLDILSKYNIKINEKLPNYALSRVRKTESIHQDYTFVPFLLRIPTRNPYRSNHLNVDPVVATLLSNGFHLPGIFRFQNNYRNLYDNLVYNNMYYKPFGPYKIYSDTDSSN